MWHQRLGHPSDSYLYNAHKYIDGVPQFKHSDPVMDYCPVCTRSEQPKTHGGGTTMKATRPWQGLSVDFAFTGQSRKDKNEYEDYLGLHGETCWILFKDHFTGLVLGKCLVSKATPLNFIRDLLQKHFPGNGNGLDRYVHMDQGGELYRNPKVCTIFRRSGFKIHPTGTDGSHQNGPVERAHRTTAKGIRSFLLGAALPSKFWPYAFTHHLRMQNALPSKGKSQSPLMMAFNKKENFKHLFTFGCRIWVRPPRPNNRRQKGKLHCDSRKGIFLGYEE